MAYKTTIEAVTWRNVGFAAIDKTYVVGGVSYPTCVALYDANGDFVEADTNSIRQFNGLASDTSYMLQSVYLDNSDEIVGVIPDTSIEFTTEPTSSYRPICSIEGGSISVEAFTADRIWMPEEEGISGFGVGVELCNKSGSIITKNSETPFTFEGLTDSEYIVRAYEWHGSGPESARIRSRVVPDTAVNMHMTLLDVFCFPDESWAELHVRLQGFTDIRSMTIYLDGEEFATLDKDLTNRVYVVRVDNLEEKTTYTIRVDVVEGTDTATKTVTMRTKECEYTREGAKRDNAFKDFYIAIGQPGAYSNNMSYLDENGDPNVIALNRDYHIKIKHAPYSPMAKIKNVVVQSWKDEDGDDVWLPKVTGSAIGSTTPATTHEAVEYNPTFIIYGDSVKMDSNAVIRKLISRIEGRWLKVWDKYTLMGFEGVYLLDIDDDPKFKRRNYDHIEFTLKFKVNGTNLDAPFEGIG